MLLFASFFIIGIISAIFFFKELVEKKVSLFLIHWYFSFLFFFLVPLVQIKETAFRYSHTNETILFVNTLIIIWSLLYFIAYRIKYEIISEHINRIFTMNLSSRYISRKLIFLSIFSLIITCYFLSQIGGISNVLTRMKYNIAIANLSEGATFHLIFLYMKQLLFWIFLFYWFIMAETKLQKRNVLFSILLICVFLAALITNNPIGQARFLTFAEYFGLFIILTYEKFKKNMIYSVMIFAILTSGPIITNYIGISRAVESVMDIKNYDRVGQKKVLLTGDYDDYDIFLSTSEFVEANGFSNGKQFLGVVLFFVPRKLWSEKPVGSGILIAENFLKAAHTNISCAAITEFYLNFGILGVILGAVLYGFLSKSFDKAYFNSLSSSRKPKNTIIDLNVYKIYYPILIGYFFFNLRGDLLSSFSYFFLSTLAFFTVVSFIRLR